VLAAPIYLVDVAFFYHSSALDSANGAGTESVLADRMIARLEASNVVLANSRIANFQWRYAGVYPVPEYARDGDLSNDIRTMVGTGEVATFIKNKGDEAGADQMVLVVGMPGNHGGLGYLPGNHCVIMWQSSSTYTLTHELGHNFGCTHDRGTVETAVTPATDTTGDGKYNYGFSYSWQMNGNTYKNGTVMSYANPLPYFSHPEIVYDGRTIGVPIGEPRAAYNAKVMADNASVVAAYRPAAGSPVITAQPGSASLVAGAALSVSVTATGNGLNYQWLKGGVAIDGATAASYTKTSAQTADGGVYVVVVSNERGVVTSTGAMVTVREASEPPAAGSSGGGGGGALSLWSSAALAAVAALRKFLR
jgi:hypothetical protein